MIATLPPTTIPITQPAGLGYSIAWQRGDAELAESLAMLPAPVWFDWTFDHAGEPGFLPSVYTMRGWSEDAATRAREVGNVWLLGSEPELAATSTDPQDAAEFSQRWAREVGDNFAAPGIATWTGGYAWIDAYLAASAVVGDYWHIHVYQIYSIDDFTAKWREWRAWMGANHVVRPTIVSEVCGWDSRVDQAAILDEIAAVQAGDPLLAAVVWYSDADYWHLWPWCDLRTDTNLTPLGEHYNAMRAPAPTATTPSPEPAPHRTYMPAIGNRP